MPKLERSQWYDLSRDMNWSFKYVTEEEVLPEALSHSHGIPAAAWWEDGRGGRAVRTSAASSGTKSCFGKSAGRAPRLLGSVWA